MALFQNLRSMSCDFPLEAYQKYHMASLPTTESSNNTGHLTQDMGYLHLSLDHLCSKLHPMFTASVSPWVWSYQYSWYEIHQFQDPKGRNRHFHSSFHGGLSVGKGVALVRQLFSDENKSREGLPGEISCWIVFLGCWEKKKFQSPNRDLGSRTQHSWMVLTSRG